MSFSGDTVLVTGGARRLGRAAVESFAREGADAVIHYRSSEEEAEELADTLRSRGCRALTIQADLTSPEEAEALLPRIRKADFFPNILINSSSLWNTDSFSDLSTRDFEASLHLSAFAPLLLSRTFAAQQERGERQEWGVIVNVLDARIADYDRRHLSYHLSKRLLSDLTRIMAVELAPQVRVNAVAPGIILPPHGTGEEQLERFRRGNLLQRIGTLEEYGEALQFLAGNAFLTGQVLYLDGGRSLRGRMYE